MQKQAQATLTSRLVDFAVSTRYAQLSPEVVAAAKNGFRDNLGVALAGSREPAVRTMLGVMQSGGAGEATVLGTAVRLSPLNAAMVNGQAAHVLDYDDTQPRGGGHMSSPTVSALLPLAETRHCTGKEVLAAYVVGFEVGCRLSGLGPFGEHLILKRGVHPMGFLGHFAAAAATGNLMGLDAARANTALGIAACQAAGLRRAFGTMCKGIHAAKAAYNGLLSALLAEQGFTGPQDILDGEFSSFHVFDYQADQEQMLEGLGQGFEILHNVLKTFACAGWRNPIVDAMIHISRQHNLRPEDVAEVRIQVRPESAALPDYLEPKTGLEGKFSTEHAAAVALAERVGGVQQFSDEKVNDPTLIALRRKVKLTANDRLEPRQVSAVVRTTSGQEISHFVPVPKGSPGNPHTQEEMEEKFRANASTVLPANQVGKLVEMLRKLEEVEDLAQLLELCHSPR